MRWTELFREASEPSRLAESLAVLLLALFSLAACGKVQSGAGKGAESSAANPAPFFQLSSLDGSEHSLSDYSDRVVLIEFWATWCGPCRLQAEILSRLYEEVRSDGVEFLAVSLGEPKSVVEEFVRRDPFPYPVLLDPDETLGYALEVYALPTVMIVDRRGEISYMRPGISDAETLRRALSAASG
jgi:peroxiredoxin